MCHYVWDIVQNMQCGIIHTNVNFQQHGKLSSAEIADAHIMLFRIAPLRLWTILNIMLQHNSEHYISEQFWTLHIWTILNNYTSKQFWTIMLQNNSEHYISEQFMCKRHEIGRLGRNLTLMILKVKGMQSLWTAFDL